MMALSSAHAQGSDAGPCRQGVLALIVMIDAEEHDKSHYRNTAASVVERCGPRGTDKTPERATAAFDKPACSQLALAMLDGIEGNKMQGPEFVKARDAFADRCFGR
jgi:hypothetical protein